MKLDELEKLSKAATNGSWQTVHISDGIEELLLYLGEGNHAYLGTLNYIGDARLIAAMRNNIDALIKVAKAADNLWHAQNHLTIRATAALFHLRVALVELERDG